MKFLKPFFGSFLLLIFLITGCKKDISKNSSDLSSDAKNELKTQARPSGLSAETKAKLDRLIAALPADFRTKVQQNSNFAKLRKEFPDPRNVITPTPCDDYTPLTAWYLQQLNDWDEEANNYANFLFLYYLPGDIAYVFENSSDNQYFGVNGEYSQVLTKTFKDLKRFWNIQTDDIVLVAMHGSMMQNRARVVQLYELYGNSTAVSEWAADLVLEVLNAFPQYRKGDHPAFTFNAYAASANDFVPPYGPLPDKITMGDGIMDGYAAIGYNDVAPQVIIAHELGHHIQLQLDLFDDVNSPEATRRTELMADAYAAYYLSHARGASMQWKRVKQFLETLFNIGDCYFDSNFHHGTPTQRMASAEWAYNLANNAKKQGHILTAQEFTVLFEAQLPILVAQ